MHSKYKIAELKMLRKQAEELLKQNRKNIISMHVIIFITNGLGMFSSLMGILAFMNDDYMGMSINTGLILFHLHLLSKHHKTKNTAINSKFILEAGIRRLDNHMIALKHLSKK